VHYKRRRPEETTLYTLVQEHLESFFVQVERETGAGARFCQRGVRGPGPPDPALTPDPEKGLKLLDRVELIAHKHKDKFPGQLSGGQ
jgi:hypothetical protein